MVEIFVSTDVEADGPIPGPHSMLSLGSAAYLADKTLVSTFEANLQPIEGAAGHPVTMRWWATQPDAWRACHENPRPADVVMKEYLAWLKSLPGRPVFVAYPAAFDFMYVAWYLNRFAGENPFGWVALDIKTFAMSMLKIDFHHTVKNRMPRRWFDEGLPHTHRALDDAIEQGALFCNMLAEHKAGRSGDG